MKVLGVVVAKRTSKRFPGKNTYQVNGKPMFWHQVMCLYALREQYGVDVDICVATDSPEIRDYCQDNSADIHIRWRGANITDSEQPLFEVVKYAWQSMAYSYDAIVVLQANSVGHKARFVKWAITKLIHHDLHEVRSIDNDGVENGMIVLHPEAMNKHELSTYVGAVRTSAKEVHYESELK